MPVPMASESGRLRRGFFTSPAVKVMSCQESAEKSEPVCATQIATSRPKAVVALSPVASGPGIAEIVVNRGGVPAEREAEQNQDDERDSLADGENILDDFAVLQAAAVGPGEHGDHAYGDELRRRKRNSIAAGYVDRRDQIVSFRNGRKEHAGKTREGNRDRRNRAGLDHGA